LGDTGLILLVEDEVILCRSTRRLLEQAGHKVVSTNSGKEALAWFHQSTEVPDLLLLDMNMPGMSGADTFRSLRKLQPQLPAVIYSGYWTPDEESSLRSEGILDFIQKPFDAQQLRETVAKALKTSRRIRISTTEIISDNE
jgi:DNA-binding NtrC family response regulator